MFYYKGKYNKYGQTKIKSTIILHNVTINLNSQFIYKMITFYTLFENRLLTVRK